MADDIVIRVVVAGEAEANAIFQNIAKTGDASFKQLNASAQQTGASFQQLGQQLGQAKFAQVGQELGQLSRGFQQAGQAVASTSAEFAQATRSISALGSTATQALAGAAAAAKQFGASANELRAVEGVINALGARARDSSTSFATLATNYDRTRGTLSNTSGVAAAATGVAKVGEEAEKTTVSAATLRREVAALAQVASALGAGPLGQLASAFTGIATRLGPIGVAITAVVAGMTALDAASVAAAKTAESLTQLARAADDSRENVSRLQQAFALLGVSSGTFTKELGSVFDKIAQQAPEVADALARAGDKLEAAQDKVAGAKLNLESVLLNREKLALQGEQISASFRDLALQKESLQLQREGLQLNAQRLQLQGRVLANQLQNLGEQQSFERRGIDLNIQDLGLRLQALELQRKLMNGTISQAEFERGMAKIAKENNAAQIAQTELALSKAQAEKDNLEFKQEAERKNLELQIKENQLAQRQNDLQLRQNDAQQDDLDRQLKGLQIQQKELEIAKQRQVLNERAAERDVRGSQQDLLVAQANDLQKVMNDLQNAGADFKFDILTTVDTQVKATLAVLGTLPGGVKEKLDKLAELAQTPGGENLIKAIGFGPEFRSALSQGVEAIEEAFNKVKGLSNDQFEALDKTNKAWNTLTGSISNAAQAVGAFNADDATQHLTTLTSKLDAAASSAKALKEAMDALGGGGKDPLGMGALLKTLTSIDIAAPIKGLLGLIGQLFTVGKASAAEGGGGTLEAIGQLGTESDKAKEKVDGLKGSVDDLTTSLGKIEEAAGNAQTALSKIGGDQEGGGLAAIAQQFTELVATITEKVDELVKAIEAAGQTISQGWTDIASSVTQGMEEIFAASVQKLSEYVDTALKLVKEASDAIKSLYALAGSSKTAGAAAAAGGLASGGLFMGRHGGIDTNLAWLTSGEFVMSVEAVKHWGPAFMHMVNAMRAPRFAAGGMVPTAARTASLARSAGSHITMAGHQGATRMLSLVIEGKTFAGLSVPENTAVALERFAVHSQLASAGRKPNWRR